MNFCITKDFQITTFKIIDLINNKESSKCYQFPVQKSAHHLKKKTFCITN